MNVRVGVLLGAASLLLAGCDLSTEPDLNERPPVLFEIEYVNYAWGSSWSGFYIDAAGDLYSFNRSDQGDTYSGTRTSFTHAELMKKLDAKRKLVRALPIDSLQAVSLLIPAAAQGTLTPPRGVCADAGVYTFRAYIFGAGNAEFRQVLLRSEGDVARENTSTQAKAIYHYLDALKLVQHFEGCQP